MPSLGIHLLVADAAFARLSSSTDAKIRDLEPIVARNPEMASLGAIGPDLLYYLGDGPKISAAVTNVFHYLYQISSTLDDLGNLTSQRGMPNTADRIRQMGETMRLLIGTSQAGLISMI